MQKFHFYPVQIVLQSDFTHLGLDNGRAFGSGHLLKLLKQIVSGLFVELPGYFFIKFLSPSFNPNFFGTGLDLRLHC